MKLKLLALVSWLPMSGVIFYASISSPCRADDVQYQQALASAVRKAAERVLPSVVSVELIGASESRQGEVEQDAPTSGVIIDDEGYILASNIVVRRPSASILVALSDGSQHSAEVVSRDHHRNLVLLKINADRSLPSIDLRGNPALPIGSTTVAVGRFGGDLAPMVSRGVLSATGRLDGIALQTDARVSPALYGGPLIDLYGNVLGILIPAVAEGGAEDDTGWYDSGIAFAVPAEVISKKLDRLKAGEDISKGLIGIVSNSRDPLVDGTKIAAVRTRSPAEAAGIKPGDSVVSIDGVPVGRHQEVKQVLGRFDAGETIAILLKRGEEEVEVSVELAAEIPPLQPQRLGVIAQEQPATDAGDDPSGIVVTAIIPGSPADGILEQGDVINTIGDADVTDLASLRRQLITAEADQPLTIGLSRGDTDSAVVISPVSIAGPIQVSVPKPWQSDQPVAWEPQEIKLPDSANDAAFVGPAPDGDEGNLGLLILVLEPGAASPMDVVKQWNADASKAGVVLCAVAPENPARWQPKELVAVANFVAALLKKAPIDPSAVAVASTGALSGGKASAADAMALATALSQSSTFFGVALSDQTRPPGMRARENEPATSLQIVIPVENEDDLPGWTLPLTKAGYPVVLGGSVDRSKLLNWVRLLQAI